MRCKSCGEDVPSKFKKAISENSCPICGDEIVDPKLQIALNNLKVALDAAQEFPEQLADWLAANYNFKKFDPNNEPRTNNNIGIVPKTISVNRIGEDDDNAETHQVDDRTDFARRAGVKLNHKKIISEIQGNMMGSADPSEFNDENSSEYESVDSYADTTPLDARGQKDVLNLFPVDTKMEQALELQKLRNYRKQFAGNDDGKIRRGGE